MPNVVSVFPSKTLHLHTTRSWDFLGVPQASQKRTNLAEIAGSYDVIAGVIDTGLWPESKSFDDSGFGSVPSRWKGFCNNTGITNSSQLFTCTKFVFFFFLGSFLGDNLFVVRKIIGGRAYPLSLKRSASKRSLRISTPFRDQIQEFNNSRDGNGHGTHTSSTLAGVSVMGASLFGLAEGTARGGYSKVRIAMYKACGFSGRCSENAIMAAFDDAVHDGVDLLSVSLGGVPERYDLDGIAIGAFHAVAKGIIVSCSAGNNGTVGPGRVSNSAPWILTVGASTIDRKIVSAVVLGNNETISGTGLNIVNSGAYDLVFAGDIPSKGSSKSDASRCLNGSVNAAKIKGKIVLCIFDQNYGFGDAAVQGAAGVILSGDFYAELLFSFALPATSVHERDGNRVLSYIKSAKNPTASILKSTTVSGVTPAPVVASFSSRGPNTLSPDIMKPDVIAPGVNILAAWPDYIPIFSQNNKSYYSNYNIDSGTSISCPHVSAAAALLKSVHPDWSPAAVRSALVTTAKFFDNTNSPIGDFNKSISGPFDTGAGEINPEKALDPGLIYDIIPEDYISYLNYPSIAFVGLKKSLSAQRTVTNVGPPESSYRLVITESPLIDIAVKPDILSFTSTGQKLSWLDSSHAVRSPIAVNRREEP